jgi:hypothetical protein
MLFKKSFSTTLYIMCKPLILVQNLECKNKTKQDRKNATKTSDA